MNIYMLKDVEHVGLAGQVVKVSDGYAHNFLLPRKLAIKATDKMVESYKTQAKKFETNKEILHSKIGMLAERLRNMHFTIKKRVHDEDKLYGAVSPDEIVELLKEKDISINRKQVEFPKSVKSLGDHKVIIRLSSKVRPEITLKIVASEE